MNKYEVVKLIGVGGEAKAHLVKRINSDKLYVMKQRQFILLEEANEGLSEAMSLAKIQSPYIVKFEEVFLDSNRETFSLCIVMEYCEGGDLMDFMYNRLSDTFKNNNAILNILNNKNNNNNNNNNSSTNSNNISNSNSNNNLVNLNSTTNSGCIKTSSSSSNNSNSSNILNNNFNNLKAYETFFSKFLVNDTLKGIHTVVEPEKEIKIISSNFEANDSGGGCLNNQLSDQSLQFSISSDSSSYLINSPSSCNGNGNTVGESGSSGSGGGGGGGDKNKSNPQSLISSPLECSSPPINGLEKISSCSGSNTPIMITSIKNVSGGGGSSTINLNESSDIVIEAMSPIKTESIGCQIMSPCSSGPTSPQMISISGDDNNSSTTPNGADKKPTTTKVPWWKTYKSSKNKEKKQSIANSPIYNDPNSISTITTKSVSDINISGNNNNSNNNKTTTTTTTSVSNNNNFNNSGNNNQSLIPKLPKRLFYSWIYQICLGVQSIHKAHLVHLDLKSENIFITESQKIKIGDFGLAKKYENTSLSGVCGTYYYLSPEILLNSNYSRPADIFSLGCIFYEMYTFHLLALTKRSIGQELIENRFDRKLFKQEFDECDEPIADLILEMLNLDPNLRPTIDLILQNKIFDRVSDFNNNSITNSSSNSNNNLCINNNSNNVNSNNNSNNDQYEKVKSSFQISSNNNIGNNNYQAMSSSFGSTSSFNEYEYTRRQLEKGDLDSAAEILCEAFTDEPRFLFVSGANSDNLESKSKSAELGQMIRKNFFSMCLKLMFDNKFMLWGCFENNSNNNENNHNNNNSDNDNHGVSGSGGSRLVSVACWSTPGKSGAPPMTQLVVKILSMVPKFGFRIMKRIGRLMSNIDRAMRNSDNKTDIYYLPYIGVAKEHRDQGVGQYLLKPVIEWAEHQRKTVKTLVFSQKQINFFSKLGFSVTHTEKIDNLKGINSIYVMSKN